MTLSQIFKEAEKAAMAKAAKIAYEASEKYAAPEIQKYMYTIYRDSITHGIYLMQLEVMERIIKDKDEQQ